MSRYAIVFLALIATPINSGTTPRKESAPTPGWVTECQVVEVHDGDTVTISYSKKMRVRLLDCWAPEVTGPQRNDGAKSRDNLSGFCLGKKAILSVPEAGKTVGDMTSMGRILGYVWVDGTNLSVMQCDQGYACKTKEEETRKFGSNKNTEEQ